MCLETPCGGEQGRAVQADGAQMPAQYSLGVQRISAIKINNKVRRVQRERGQKSLFKYLGNYYFNYNENVFIRRWGFIIDTQTPEKQYPHCNTLGLHAGRMSY